MSATQLLQMVLPALVAAIGASVPLMIARRGDRDRLVRIESQLEAMPDRVALQIREYCEEAREKCPALREHNEGYTPVRGVSQR